MRTHLRPETGRRRRTGAPLAHVGHAWLALAVTGLLGASGPAGAGARDPARPAQREPVVMIGLAIDAARATIACDGAMRLWRRGSGLRGSELDPGTRLDIAPAPLPGELGNRTSGATRAGQRGLRVSDERRGLLGVFSEDLILEPLMPGELLRVDDQSFRGEVVVRLAASGKLTIINAVRIEEYLRGVVPAELGRGIDVPAAALEAQAIAARSYTLFYLGRRADQGFDLVAGPADQVYEGAAGETAAADAAVETTRGLVATHGGRPIRANYSSTCGGKTATSGAIWPGEDFPYLTSVTDRVGGEDLCSGSPYHRWTESWPAGAFQEQLLANLRRELPEAAAADPGQIRRLEIRGRTPSGRVEALAIHTDRGVFTVRGDRIRWVLRRANGQPLRSTLFGKLKRRSEGGRKLYILEGAGYGHGAGLCQFGAMGMARRGASAAEILAHYYRDTALVRWW
jgi:stage II sporulation protein D